MRRATPPPDIDAPAGVTTRYLFGPAPALEPLIRLRATSDAMSEVIANVFPAGPPAGAVERAVPQGIIVGRTTRILPEDDDRLIDAWILVGPDSRARPLDPSRVDASDTGSGVRVGLAYDMTPTERGLLRSGEDGPAFGVVTASEVLIVGGAETPAGLTLEFGDERREDVQRIRTALAADPLPVRLTPIPTSP